ncbi:MAG: hypothetical protein H7070_09580 [Saprospiraceae bacterium]|nr:hypothetical protein [Pyrinomonadaceae bacterium]
MDVSSKHLTKLVKKPIAAFMAFWLSGFLFLFCCGSMPSANAAAEHCPLKQKSEHCDRGSEKNNAVSRQTGHASLGCCAYLSIVFDKARKIDRMVDSSSDVPAEVQVDAPKLRSVAVSFQTPAAYSPPVLYRKNVFIDNCVFRI